MNERITITIDREVYDRLKERGLFGETYSELISRIIKISDSNSTGERNE